MTKTCIRCKKTLNVIQFNNKTAASDGLQPWCKQCSKEYNAKRNAPKATAAPPKRRSRRSVVRISPRLYHLIEVIAATNNVTPGSWIEATLKTNVEDRILDAISEL